MRERGADPKRARLTLADGVEVQADHVGCARPRAPDAGLAAQVSAPNLRLVLDTSTIPVLLLVIEADGSVTLAHEAWDGVEALAGHLGGMIGGPVEAIVRSLGWLPEAGVTPVRLPLADLVASPGCAARLVAAACDEPAG